MQALLDVILPVFLLIGAGYVLGYEWRLISEYIKAHLPLIFIGGFLLSTAYLLYHFRASLPFGWLKINSKSLDSE